MPDIKAVIIRAITYVGSVNLGEQLVKQGHAVKFKGKIKKTWC
jgi:endonuclease YncB( thermonuclease family)